eukprot:TRINITY_DN31598_c0_g1_i1.p1 TRINITY_DN31598_c0_g1~~TRINITY_DN31598_c0_g1_i1.p1  ORF type:complete len:728 (-),score=153.67 TRINITY_DN31598_c0_g1_i1:256-2439(-)
MHSPRRAGEPPRGGATPPAQGDVVRLTAPSLAIPGSRGPASEVSSRPGTPRHRVHSVYQHDEESAWTPGGGLRHPKVTITPNGSIYDYLFFVVPSSKVKYGTTWSRSTKHALVLVVVNLFLQLCLTLVAGSFVMESVSAWKQNLVSSPEVVEYVSRRSVSYSEYLRTQTWKAIGTVYGGGKEKGETKTKSKQLAPGEQLMPHCQARKGPATPEGAKSALKDATSDAANAGALPGFLAHDTGKPGGSGGKKGGAKISTIKDDEEEELTYLPAPLCTEKDGMYNCLPPSVQVASYWDKLDWNGDGVWTLEEARADAAGISCLVQMWPEQVFMAIAKFLNSQRFTEVAWVQEGYWLHPDVKEYKAIPQAYFDMWLGLVGVCIHSDSAMCGSLLLKGIFDGAMSPAQNMSGMGDLQSAMDSCTAILAPEGLCDHALPQTYKLFRARHAEQCGAAHYAAGPIYTNPFRPDDQMYVAMAMHANVDSFHSADNMNFCVFQISVLLVFLISLFSEVKELVKQLQFLLAFPSTDPEDQDKALELDNETGTVRIVSIAPQHRIVIAICWFFRMIIAVYIGWIGTAFLLADRDLLNLLLNAVALVFVLEIDELLYHAMASSSTKLDIEATEPIEFESPFGYSSLWRRFFSEWAAFTFLVFLVVVFVFHHRYFTTKPILASLTCACEQEGEDCLDAFVFDKAWFDKYWLETLPAAHQTIAALKLKVQAAAAAAATAAGL